MKNQIREVKTSKDHWKPRNNKIFKRAKEHTYTNQPFFNKKLAKCRQKVKIKFKI
jgi:hypothetical protein